MLLLGHLGISMYAAERAAAHWRLSWSWRAAAVVALCTLLPDLVDKPMLWLGLAPAHTGRNWAHSLWFSAAWCLACWRWLPALWPWALATPLHLICDRPWAFPRTLVWPLAGGFDELLPQGITHTAPGQFMLWRVETNPALFALDMAAEALGAMLLLLVVLRLLPRPDGQPNWAVDAPPGRG